MADSGVDGIRNNELSQEQSASLNATAGATKVKTQKERITI